MQLAGQQNFSGGTVAGHEKNGGENAGRMPVELIARLAKCCKDHYERRGYKGHGMGGDGTQQGRKCPNPKECPLFH
ncbi:hypothetical protein PRBRB14_06590 [Hallella multisaccharivorax DSM 17128]|uniref:hypothetical protein n=1 Tax=Hallella multisaccharivorax TaxID=310514 RepID=UPI0012EACC42|nr:hypothetical protein [Hallella multisaccharivorax]GJG29780.1 hypothetical protein PRBRB14_06590 [Hallella multisaccharivorax DSM 17128]